MSIVQHSAATPEHYTPSEIIHAAWEVMGVVDLDPATTAEVNRDLVGAKNFYTKETNGLAAPWFGKVWLNPPGGVAEDRRSNAAVWWEKLVYEWVCGRVHEALFMGFTLEILKTTQASDVWIGSVPFCIPRARLDFLQRQEDGTYQRGGQPAHANIIAYLPPRIGFTRDQSAEERFERVFSKFGKVRR